MTGDAGRSSAQAHENRTGAQFGPLPSRRYRDQELGDSDGAPDAAAATAHVGNALVRILAFLGRRGDAARAAELTVNACECLGAATNESKSLALTLLGDMRLRLGQLGGAELALTHALSLNPSIQALSQAHSESDLKMLSVVKSAMSAMKTEAPSAAAAPAGPDELTLTKSTTTTVAGDTTTTVTVRLSKCSRDRT